MSFNYYIDYIATLYILYSVMTIILLLPSYFVDRKNRLIPKQTSKYMTFKMLIGYCRIRSSGGII